MDNYVIHFEKDEREEVLTLLSRFNDIIINNVEPTAVGITIQQDDNEPIYHAILEKIEREIRLPHRNVSAHKIKD
jgi:hypothetical protein